MKTEGESPAPPVAGHTGKGEGGTLFRRENAERARKLRPRLAAFPKQRRAERRGDLYRSVLNARPRKGGPQPADIPFSARHSVSSAPFLGLSPTGQLLKGRARLPTVSCSHLVSQLSFAIQSLEVLRCSMSMAPCKSVSLRLCWLGEKSDGTSSERCSGQRTRRMRGSRKSVLSGGFGPGHVSSAA